LAPEGQGRAMTSGPLPQNQSTKSPAARSPCPAQGRSPYSPAFCLSHWGETS